MVLMLPDVLIDPEHGHDDQPHRVLGHAHAQLIICRVPDPNSLRLQNWHINVVQTGAARTHNPNLQRNVLYIHQYEYEQASIN